MCDLLVYVLSVQMCYSNCYYTKSVLPIMLNKIQLKKNSIQNLTLARLRLNRRHMHQYSTNLTMGRVYRGCSWDGIFWEWFAGFFTQTVKNDFQLSNFVSKVRIEVLVNVNCNHNPKHIYKC